MNKLKKSILLVGAPLNESGFASLGGGVWEVSNSMNAAEAAALCGKREFDAVVADERLADMDGFKFLDLLQELRPEARRFIVAELSDPRVAARSVRSGHRCIPKPWDTEVLREIVERAFSLSVWLYTPAVVSLLQRMTVIPSPPDLYFAVVRALNSPEASFEQITRRAEQDPAMTAKLLKVANSAAIGLYHEVTNVGEAIQYLGLETVRSLILLAHTFSYAEPNRVSGFSMERLWKHSLSTGKFARRIAREERASPKAVDEAFLAGLLHDLGELLFAINLPKEYAQAIEEAQKNATPLWRAELERLGATHATIGGELMASWNLPPAVVEAIALHHQPTQVVTTGFSPLTAVHVADAIAVETEGKDSLDAAVIDQPYLEHLGLAGRLDAWKQACLHELSPA